MIADLVAAVRARNTSVVKELLDRDPTLASAKTNDGSILITAVYSGAQDCVSLIREHKTDLDLAEAVVLNDLERVATLLHQRPLAATEPLETRMPPLHLAAYSNRTEIVRMLLDCGANVNAFSLNEAPTIPRNTALHAAIAGGAWETAELLMAHGADVNAVDSIGGTPLHNAAARTNPDIVEKLLANGAQVNVRNNGGGTPLSLALKKGHTAVADVLRNHIGVE